MLIRVISTGGPATNDASVMEANTEIKRAAKDLCKNTEITGIYWTLGDMFGYVTLLVECEGPEEEIDKLGRGLMMALFPARWEILSTMLADNKNPQYGYGYKKEGDHNYTNVTLSYVRR